MREAGLTLVGEVGRQRRVESEPLETPTANFQIIEAIKRKYDQLQKEATTRADKVTATLHDGAEATSLMRAVC